jgi:hypothetical protein
MVTPSASWYNVPLPGRLATLTVGVPLIATVGVFTMVVGTAWALVLTTLTGTVGGAESAEAETNSADAAKQASIGRMVSLPFVGETARPA